MAELNIWVLILSFHAPIKNQAWQYEEMIHVNACALSCKKIKNKNLSGYVMPQTQPRGLSTATIAAHLQGFFFFRVL